MNKYKFILASFIFSLIFLTGIHAQNNKEESKSRMDYFEVEAPSLKSFEKVKVGVYLPNEYDSAKKSFPVVYFLHGFNQDETSWEKMGIKEILDNLIVEKKLLPMIVVAPFDNKKGWSNWFDGSYKGEDFLIKDLIKAIDEKYRTISKPCRRGISGNSAGGTAALRLGFEYPNLFSSIASHSAGIQPENPNELPNWAKNWEGWEPRVGKPINVAYWKKINPLYLAGNLPKEQLENQLIYFDVGEKDHLGFAKTNALLSEILKKRDVKHSFFLREGGHGSKFVKDNAKYALEFHGRAFQETCN